MLINQTLSIFKAFDLERGVVFFLYSLFQLVAFTQFSFEIGLLILTVFSLVSRFLFYREILIGKSSATFVVAHFVEIPMFFYLVGYFFGFVPKEYDINGLRLSYEVGCYLITASFIFFKLFQKIKYHNYTHGVDIYQRPYGLYLVFFVFFVLVAFGASALCYKLGIGALGVKAPYYPFKVESILNHLGTTAIPFFFIVFLDLFLEKKDKKMIVTCLSLFFLWTLAESIVRSSRGVFFFILISIIALAYFRGLFPLRKIALMVVGAVLFAVISYPFIKNYRVMTIQKEQITASKIIERSLRDFSYKYHYYEIFRRIYGAGEEIIKFESHVESKWLGADFEKIKNAGGGIQYHTYEVDKSPKHIPHSAGVNALGDGFLYLGIVGTVGTLLILFLWSWIIDARSISFLTATNAGVTMLFIFLLHTIFSGRGIWSPFQNSILYNMVWPLQFVALYVFSRKFKFES